jgi:hypothetical protein
VQYAAPLI